MSLTGRVVWTQTNPITVKLDARKHRHGSQGGWSRIHTDSFSPTEDVIDGINVESANEGLRY